METKNAYKQKGRLQDYVTNVRCTAHSPTTMEQNVKQIPH